MVFHLLAQRHRELNILPALTIFIAMVRESHIIGMSRDNWHAPITLAPIVEEIGSPFLNTWHMKEKWS